MQGRVAERFNVGDVYQSVEEQWDKASAKVRQLLHALRPYEPECVVYNVRVAMLILA